MIYLNNAATSFPKPDSVGLAVKNSISSIPAESGRSTDFSDDNLTTVRKTLADLFQSESYEQVILLPSATYALNAILLALGMNNPNTHCLSTSMEHNSVLRPLNVLKEKHNISVSYYEPDVIDNRISFNLDSFAALIKPETSFIVATHSSNVTGMVTPIEDIAAIAAEKQIPLIIDGAQSAGSIPLAIQKLPGSNVYVFAGHKGLFGPRGTGGFITKDFDFEPVISGGTGVFSESLTQPSDLPYKYEVGTPNESGFAGLQAALSFVQQTGLERITKHKSRLTAMLVDGLRKLKGISLYLPANNDFRNGILSFTIENKSTEECGFILKESFNIICREGLHCAPLFHKTIGTAPEGTIRLSVSWFTKDEDIEYTIKAVKQICEF